MLPICSWHGSGGSGRRVVEGSEVCSTSWRVMHVDVHGEVMLWVTNECGRCGLLYVQKLRSA